MSRAGKKPPTSSYSKRERKTGRSWSRKHSERGNADTHCARKKDDRGMIEHFRSDIAFVKWPAQQRLPASIIRRK